LHVSGWDVIASGFSAVTTEATGRVYFALWYCVGVLLLMNVITSFFISAFILKIDSLNIGREVTIMRASSSSKQRDDMLSPSPTTGEEKPKNCQHQTFHRTNVLSIKQSTLDETALQYPTDDREGDLEGDRAVPKNSFQLIIEQAKSSKEKRLLSTLSLRYSSAINNERVSEIKSLLTSDQQQQQPRHHRHLLSGEGEGGGEGSGEGNYRKNFIVDCERVRDLSDRELMVIINRMVEDKKVSSLF
jgi:hypothetical protein